MSLRTRRKILPQPAVYQYRPDLHTHEIIEFAQNPGQRAVLVFVERKNPRVWTRYIWGADPFEGNSDLVCALIFTGFFQPHSPFPGDMIGLVVSMRIMEPQEIYPARTNFFIRSRDGRDVKESRFSYRIDNVKQVLPYTVAPRMQFGMANDLWLVYSLELIASGFFEPCPNYDDLVAGITGAPLIKSSKSMAQDFMQTGLAQRFFSDTLYIENDEDQFEICADPHPLTFSDILGQFPRKIRNEVERKLIESLPAFAQKLRGGFGIDEVSNGSLSTMVDIQSPSVIANEHLHLTPLKNQPKMEKEIDSSSKIDKDKDDDFGSISDSDLNNILPPVHSTSLRCVLCGLGAEGTAICQCSLQEPHDPTLPLWHPLTPALRLSRVLNPHQDGYISLPKRFNFGVHEEDQQLHDEQSSEISNKDKIISQPTFNISGEVNLLSVPKDLSQLEVLERNLDSWELKWGVESIQIRGIDYQCKRIRFLTNASDSPIVKSRQYQLPIHFPKNVQVYSRGRERGWGTDKRRIEMDDSDAE